VDITGDAVVPACLTDSHPPRLAMLLTDAEEVKFRNGSVTHAGSPGIFLVLKRAGGTVWSGGTLPLMTGGTPTLLLS
jgi:hypothetical protein